MRGVVTCVAATAEVSDGFSGSHHRRYGRLHIHHRTRSQSHDLQWFTLTVHHMTSGDPVYQRNQREVSQSGISAAGQCGLCSSALLWSQCRR